MRKRLLLLCTIMFCSLVNAQMTPLRSSIVLANEPAAKGGLDVEQFRLSLGYVQEELGRTKTEPPGVLVIRLTQQTAGALGVGDGIYLQLATETHDMHPPYYEELLTREYSTRAYVFMADKILESHYGLALDNAARNALIERVIRKLNSKVSISALQHH